MSIESLQQSVLKYLTSTTGAISVDRVARALRAPRHRVSGALLELQGQGRVERTPMGWRAKGPVRETVPPPSGAGAGRNTNDTVSVSAGPAGPHTQVLPTPDDPALTYLPASSRWLDFRRLMLYYAECVRVEERPSISVYGDREGSEFLSVEAIIDWRSLVSGIEVGIPIAPDSERFLRRLRGRGKNQSFYIGTPVDVFVGSGDSGAFRAVSPVFVIQVFVRLDGTTLRLQPVPLIEVNHGWLKRCFPKLERRQEFLDQIGVGPTALDIDDGEPVWALNDLKEAVRGLHVLQPQRWKEYPDLSAPSQKPRLAEIGESGLYNRVVLVPQPKLKFAARLHRELHTLATKVSDEELDRSALSVLFPHRPPSSSPDPTAEDPGPEQLPIAEYQLLNEEQREACEAAMRERLTVLTGPPGTGKSMVVAHLLANCSIQGRSALFASRNHQALEAVEPRLNALVEPEVLVVRPTRPYGDHRANFEWHRAMAELLSRPHRLELAHELADAKRRLQGLQEEQAELEEALRAWVDAQDRLAKLEERRRILVRDDQALDSLAEALAGPAAAPEHEELGRLLSMLDGAKPPWYGVLRRWRRHRAWRRAAPIMRGTLAAASEAGAKVPVAVRLDDPMTRPEPELIRAWHRLTEVVALAVHARSERARLQRIPDREAAQERLSVLRQELEVATRETLARVAEAAGMSIPPEQRERFAQLRAAMQNRPDEWGDPRRETPLSQAFADAIGELLKHFPAWAVSNLSTGRAIPLTTAAFDLAIIDEASQCDIPSIVPLLFRARRVSVVGDPNQLAHVTQLTRDTEMRLREQYGVQSLDFERFTYVANSAFTLASSSAAAKLVELRAHYRCHPAIAAYCNESFYGKTLRVQTDLEGLRRRLGRSDVPGGCRWEHVPADPRPAQSGCYCPNQVEAVATALARLAEEDFPGSVGVVTPFRAQANRIRDRVHELLPTQQIERWRLLVDTADGFQGDERDLVVFSLVGGRAMPAGSAHFLAAHPNRFNVAASRARLLLRVFGDREWAANCGIGFVSNLLRRCEQPHEGVSPRLELIGPVWEPRFADELKRAGLPILQQYPACGFYLDFAILDRGRRINVEVDGETYHRTADGRRRLEDVYRDVMLKAAGWTVLRFWVYQLRENMDECVERVRRAYSEWRPAEPGGSA